MKNPQANDVGRLAERMAQGYYAHLAAISVATDPRATRLAPQTEPTQIVPVGYVRRLDGTAHVYDFLHYLEYARVSAALAEDFQTMWLGGALLAVGDALAEHNYFDRAPELELLRHLRNGIAHGNNFRIDNPKNLAKYPAHNRLAWVRSDSKSNFEITAGLQGQKVLFAFMGPGDTLDLLMSVGMYLTRMGSGDALRPPAQPTGA